MRRAGDALLWAIAIVVAFVIWGLARMQARINAHAVGDTQHRAKSQPARAPGSQIPFERGPDVLPDAIPHLRLTHAFIPSSGFDAMTRIGNINQPQLLLDPALFDRFRTAPIPQPVVAPQATPNLPPEHFSEFEGESVLPSSGFFYE